MLEMSRNNMFSFRESEKSLLRKWAYTWRICLTVGRRNVLGKSNSMFIDISATDTLSVGRMWVNQCGWSTVWIWVKGSEKKVKKWARVRSWWRLWATTLRSFKLFFEQLGARQNLLVWVFHLIFNRFQDKIKHAQILVLINNNIYYYLVREMKRKLGTVQRTLSLWCKFDLDWKRGIKAWVYMFQHATLVQGRFDKAMDKSLSYTCLSEVTHVLLKWALPCHTCCVQSSTRSALWGMWPCPNLAMDLKTQQLGCLASFHSYSWRALWCILKATTESFQNIETWSDQICICKRIF